MKKKTDGKIILDERVERETDSIACPECNGYADRVRLTKKEIDTQSCGRSYECCGRAFVCRLCKKRIVGNAFSPEME